MTTSVTPFLMFTGRAEEAVTLYVSLLPDSEVVSMTRYGPGEPGAEGSVKLAEFTLAGRRYRCIDSVPVHDFDFTPSWSLFVDCDDRAQFDHLLEVLSQDGILLMPPNDYGFSTAFAWLNDRFGVSWQINLPRPAGAS